VAEVQTSTHPFQAEVAAVLRLVTNSLYTNREIFLRELVSNASDALDKARYQALVDKTLEGQELAPRIDIVADKQRGVLVIEDTGVGMTAEEAAQNLGTIAHSGTLKFLEQAAKKGDKPDLSLIGQFGVGFYSAFMVADHIDVHSRSAVPGSAAVHWSSTGGGGYTLGPSDRATRGTRIELHLRDDAKEFLESWRLQSLVKRYSDYVLHPIHIASVKDDGTAEEATAQANQAKAFWTQNPKSLGDDDYAEFYKHVMGGFVLPAERPLARLHVSMDAPIQFHAVLFVPDRRPLDLFQEDAKHLQLYARRVLVMENCDKLLPGFLRFFRGIVDSEDLPLNVSRETLQEHQSLAAIRRQLTRKALHLLADTAKDDPATYAKIWREFGVFLKEGVHTDSGHREQLTELLRFASTAKTGESDPDEQRDPDKLVSLREYVDAMPEGQEAIYYITGEHAEDLAKSPHLEACRARGWSVLLMTDAVDEWVVQDLDRYADKPLVSVTKGELDLPTGDTAVDSSAIAALVERTKAALGERVKDVRASRRLTDSAACLVDDESGLGRNMERILKMAGRDVRARARVLELNPEHPFVRAAQTLATEHPDDPRLPTWIELLHDQAHLAEGSVPDPAGVVRRIQTVLDSAAGLTDQGGRA
jgi:molecular chaperone HtpG